MAQKTDWSPSDDQNAYFKALKVGIMAPVLPARQRLVEHEAMTATLQRELTRPCVPCWSRFSRDVLPPRLCLKTTSRDCRPSYRINMPKQFDHIACDCYWLLQEETPMRVFKHEYQHDHE